MTEQQLQDRLHGGEALRESEVEETDQDLHCHHYLAETAVRKMLYKFKHTHTYPV